MDLLEKVFQQLNYSKLLHNNSKIHLWGYLQYLVFCDLIVTWMFRGRGAQTNQETVMGPPNYRVWSLQRRSEWIALSSKKKKNQIKFLQHTWWTVTLTVWPGSPQPSQYGNSVWPLSRLEWGLRLLGPNQSLRTNAGRATGWALLRCVLWSPARHIAVPPWTLKKNRGS